MRKFLNWLAFFGKVFTSLGNALEPLLPAYDEVKQKNALIDLARAAKEADEAMKEQPIDEILTVQPSAPDKTIRV
jgi:hypothetical protein